MKTQRVSMRVDRVTLEGDDSFAPIEPVWWTADIYHSPAEYESSLAAFTRAQRLFSAIHWYWSEVNNGGHYQFYDNSTGIVWRDALAGFELLGLHDFAFVLQESAGRLGGQPPLDREERLTLLERLAPEFDDLDERFYTLVEKMNLDARMLEYMRQHADEFKFEGIVEKPVFPEK